VKYLEALPALAQGKGSTIFLPSEAAGVMGALGGLRALLGSGGPIGGGQAAADRSEDASDAGTGTRPDQLRLGAPYVAALGSGGLFPTPTIAPLPAVGRSVLADPTRFTGPGEGSGGGTSRDDG
jgi:hypothetical protein